jgi:signal transduction histidine kinase
VSIVAGLLILVATGAAAWTIARHTRELIAARNEVEQANASLEDRVKRRTSDLTRANDEIQRFAYIVSHDLRSPLVNILGFTSELETSLKSLQHYVDLPPEAPVDAKARSEAKLAADADMPEALGFIRTSTNKMDKLINAILTLSRQGRRELHPEQVDLGELIDAAAASVQHQLSQSSGEFTVGNPMPRIYSDRLALEQIFGNLVDNAIKYGVDGRPPRITIAAEERRGWVTIKVTDNGRGIASQDYDRIFDLFRRAGVQDRSGEGIGLAHVRALVRRLGGEIAVDSELGTGSTFTVILPKTYSPQVT